MEYPDVQNVQRSLSSNSELELDALGSDWDDGAARPSMSLADIFEDINETTDDGDAMIDDESVSIDSWEQRIDGSLIVRNEDIKDSQLRRKTFTQMDLPISETSLDRATSGGGRNAITEFSINDLGFYHEYDEMRKSERRMEWLKGFRRSDPRYKILSFFNDVAQEGADKIEEKGFSPNTISPLLRAFYKASVFSVWRPTSLVAIRRMMLGEAVGKGLDIKGKSARKGKLSGFVPFMQIYKEEHKRSVRTPAKDGSIRVFYKSKADRNVARDHLGMVLAEMIAFVFDADQHKDDEAANNKILDKARKMEMEDPAICLINDYSPNCYGLELPERLFWEGYCLRQDISREPGSEFDAGRPSEPAFQDMNFSALEKVPERGSPRAVLFQHTDKTDSPMCPQTLLMAYEEDGRVLPVVSDFDCFLVGTRGVKYTYPLPPGQLRVVEWCVSQIEEILDGERRNENWTTRWLDVLKKSAKKGFHPEIPPLGFSDPKSHSIMEYAIKSLKKEGAVRHGAECFNYYFPQELDDYFLVISDNLSGASLAWKYVNTKGLQEILMNKVDQGYTFPLNPKWVLCDPGWKEIYDKLLVSDRSNVQDSVNAWYPPESGLRERIEEIHKRHPSGFMKSSGGEQPTVISYVPDGDTQRDLAEMELNRFMTLRRAKNKLKAYVYWKRLYLSRQRTKAAEASEGSSSNLRMSIVPVQPVKVEQGSSRVSRISMVQSPGTPLIDLDEDAEDRIEELESELIATRSSLTSEIDELEKQLKMAKMQVELLGERVQEALDEKAYKAEKEAEERYNELEEKSKNDAAAKDKEIAILKRQLRNAMSREANQSKKAGWKKKKKKKMQETSIKENEDLTSGDEADNFDIVEGEIDAENADEKKQAEEDGDDDGGDDGKKKSTLHSRERALRRKINKIKVKAEKCIMETRKDADKRVSQVKDEMKKSLHLKDNEISRLMKELRRKESLTATMRSELSERSTGSSVIYEGDDEKSERGRSPPNTSKSAAQSNRFGIKERTPPNTTVSASAGTKTKGMLNFFSKERKSKSNPTLDTKE